MADTLRPRTSDLLRGLAEAAPERVSLAMIAGALEDRGFGIVVLCLALPNAFPGPYIPGLSTLLALPIVWMGLQLVLGRRRAPLPAFLGRVSFSRSRFVGFVNRATPWIVWVERQLKPRPSWLTRGAGLRSLGGMLILLAALMAVPIPFGNIPLGLSIAMLALGLIEEDSRALAVGLAAGVVGGLWQLFLGTIGFRVIDNL
ncbi:MAG TPA: exopolysaccharide biosynthesis protein [Stellaceae bacterium]|nr:exopolysaccharide biosynthesis protein [Stellaceae bacterium]